VRDAEQIVVLDRGRIAERGTHDELASRGGRYAAMLTGAGELEPA
jgi:ATP-binding cassette subfamily B protein